MSGIDELLACCGLCTLCCCCLDAIQNQNMWCFMRCCGSSRWRVRTEDGCCSCRRTMNDHEFERTVEELYAPNKPTQYPDGTSHALELQERGGTSGGGEGRRSRAGAIDTQPGARPSMEAPPPPPAAPRENETEEERERRMLDSRSGAKDRTREWIEQQGSSSAPRRSGERRRPSDPPIASTTNLPPDAEGAPPMPQPKPHRQLSSETRRSASQRGAGDEEDGDEDEDDRSRGPPRTDIPAALMPGRRPSMGRPAQLPMPDFGEGFAPQAHARAPSGPSSDEVGGGRL